MRFRIATVALVALLVPAASAFAVTKPTAATGGVSNLMPTSVTLLGKANPKSAATSYYFQYGKTTGYGLQSNLTPIGSSATTQNASAAIVGLVPNTKYHYQLVAVNSAGPTLGGDKTFTTPKQPLGLSLVATPNPVLFGGSSTINATLTGTGNTNRTIVLSQRPFPYTAAFAPVGNPEVTNSTGVAAFPIVSLTTNTQYTASVKGASPAVVAPTVTVDVAVGIKLGLHSHHVHSGSLVTFSGTVNPGEDGAQYAIQKLRGTTWVNVAGGSLHHDTATSSKFSIHVKVSHSASYRVFVGVNDGGHASNSSSDIRLTVIPHVVHHH